MADNRTTHSLIPEALRSDLRRAIGGNAPAKESEARPDAYPPKAFSRVISLSELIASNGSVMIPDPSGDGAEGSKQAPILITYDGSISPDRVQIDNQTGILKVDGVHRVQWQIAKDRAAVDPNNKSRHWLRDELGPHLHIAPIDAEGAPDTHKMIPVSVPATRAHWMHSNRVYTSAEQVTPYLTPPAHGRYHKLTPPPGQEEKLQPADKVDTTRLDYRQWSYENGAKTAYNMLHWQPDQKNFKPERQNLFAFNLASLESSWKDTPGFNPFITNYAGYMGLFQFGIPALGAYKDMMKQGQWQGVEINGDKITNNAAFLNNWQAQMAAFQYHAHEVAQGLQKTWNETHNAKHMKAVSLVGLMAAAHLRGPGSAKEYAKHGTVKRDGTGTPNSLYAQRYGVLGNDTFYRGSDISVTYDTQSVLEEMFEREHPGQMRRPLADMELPREIQHKQIALPDNTRTLKAPVLKIEHASDGSWVDPSSAAPAKKSTAPAKAPSIK